MVDFENRWLESFRDWVSDLISRGIGNGLLNIDMVCVFRFNILIFFFLMKVNFFNSGNKRILLGNISINLKDLFRDLI